MILPDEAVSRFRKGLEEAVQAGEIEPTAMTLATLGLHGGVSARMVLLKDFSPEGFVFYTNMESIKGLQLAADPQAALVFHWKMIHQQVRVEGRVLPLPDEEADAYFVTRDRGSQLGAWASDQSRPMKSRAELVKRVAMIEAKHLAQTVPRPPHWSGYRVLPEMIEFWYGRKSRLHDRYRYASGHQGWQMQRLYP